MTDSKEAFGIVERRIISERVISEMKEHIKQLEKDVVILKSIGFCLPTIPDKIEDLKNTINSMIH